MDSVESVESVETVSFPIFFLLIISLFYNLNFPPTGAERVQESGMKYEGEKNLNFAPTLQKRKEMMRNADGEFCYYGRAVPRAYVCLQIFCLVGKWRDDIMEIEVHGKWYLAPLTSLPLAHFRDNVPCGRNIYCWGGCGFWFVRTLEDRSSRKYNTAGNLQVCWISLYVL